MLIQQQCVWPHTCTSYVLYAYLYCVYALVGGAISIRDPYICAIHESVPTNRTLSSTGSLSVQWKHSYRLQNWYSSLFREKSCARMPELLEVSKLHYNFWTKRVYKNCLFLIIRIAMNLLVSLFCDSNVWGGRLEWTHTHIYTGQLQ